MSAHCRRILGCVAVLVIIPLVTSTGLAPAGSYTAGSGNSNKTANFGYAQGIGITLTNIGGINLAAGTFQATFLLYSRIARVPTRLNIGTEARETGDIQNECPGDTSDWAPWQGAIAESFARVPMTTDKMYGFLVSNGDPFVKITPQMMTTSEGKPLISHYLVQGTFYSTVDLRHWPRGRTGYTVLVRSPTRHDDATFRQFCILPSSTGVDSGLRFPGTLSNSHVSWSTQTHETCMPPYNWTMAEQRLFYQLSEDPNVNAWETCPASKNMVHQVPADHTNCECMAGITLTTQCNFTVWKTEPTQSALISYYLPGGFIALASLTAYILPHDNAPSRLSVSSGALVSATMFHANVRTKIPVVSYVTDIDKFLLVIYTVISMGFVVTMICLLLRRKMYRPITAKRVSNMLTAFVVPESILLLLYFTPNSENPNDHTLGEGWLIATPFVVLVVFALAYIAEKREVASMLRQLWHETELQAGCVPEDSLRIPQILHQKPMSAWSAHDVEKWLNFCLRHAPQRLKGCGELLEEARIKGASLETATVSDFRGLGMRWEDAETLHRLKEEWLAGTYVVAEDVVHTPQGYGDDNGDNEYTGIEEMELQQTHDAVRKSSRNALVPGGLHSRTGGSTAFMEERSRGSMEEEEEEGDALRRGPR